jgi:hypothetical protein
MSPFAFQVGEYIMFSSSIEVNGTVAGNLLHISLLQLPYNTADEPFNIELLVLPMVLTVGFSGMILCILDVLTLKTHKIDSLFRAADISEWTINLGIIFY